MMTIMSTCQADGSLRTCCRIENVFDDTGILQAASTAGGKRQMETAGYIDECSLVREARGGNHAAYGARFA